MVRKINKTDIIFISALIVGLVFHISTVFFQHNYPDEIFYYTIPLRLVNGDSLVQHEWHLTQFSSLFSYLPVRIFTMLKGSTEGIIVFMRCVYIFIHTAVSVGIYRFFKEYKVWAIAASMVFYTQVSYAIYAISYHSMFAVFILLFTFCLISAVKKSSPIHCIGAGFCYGACCVCNPVLVFAFAGYALFCVIWTNKNKKEKFSSEALKTKKQNAKFSITDLDCIQSYGNLFSGKAFLFSVTGIVVIAIICIVFFFSTGGTLASIKQNTENLLNSSEYEVIGNSFGIKIKYLFNAVSAISFKMPFLLPLMLVVLACDKKRMQFIHRATYIFIAFVISCIYVFGIAKKGTADSYIFSLPFAIFSAICYVLTEKKNKILFYCMWCVCMVGACIHGMVSNTLLTSAGVVVSVANIAGVFLVRDLFCEMSADLPQKHSVEKHLSTAVRVTVCATLCFQMVFYAVAIYSFKAVGNSAVMENTGPFAGMLMSEEQHTGYLRALEDLETIKKRSNKDDPCMLMSDEIWMYLCIDRPFGVFTTWNQDFSNPEAIVEYYKVNADRVPKYIYVPKTEQDGSLSEIYEYNEELIKEMFDYTEEELSGGLLLTVTEYKLETE